jgi:hypothetical protein
MKHIIGFFKHWWANIEGIEIAILLATFCFITLVPLIYVYGYMNGIAYLLVGVAAIAFVSLVIVLFVHAYMVVAGAIDSYKDKVRRDEERVINRLKGVR